MHACAHIRGSWDIPNMGCEPGNSKGLTKGNREEMSHKSNSNCHEGETQWLCLSPSPPVCISTVLFFLLINTLLALLLSVFVEILFCKAKGPGPLSLTTGLVARIWYFHCCDLTWISGWEPKLCSKLLQGEATQDQGNRISSPHFMEECIHS